MRASGLPVEAGARTASTDATTQSGFPDLLSKMAAAGDRAPSPPVISVAERRWAWGRVMSQSAPALEESNDGSESRLAAQPADDSDSSADAANQAAALQQTAGPTLFDTTSIASASPLSGAASGPGQATTGVGVPQDSPVGQDRSVFPQAPTANAARLQATSADGQAIVSGGVAATEFVSVIGQETHFAPVGVQHRWERAMVGDESAAPAQGTEHGGTESPASVVSSRMEQGAAGRGSVALGSSTSDGTVSRLASEPAPTFGAAPLPSRQVAGQTVAAAGAADREGAGRESSDPPGRIATTGSHPPGQPETALAQPRWSRGGVISRASRAARDETSAGSDPTLTARPAGENAPSGDAENRASVLQQSVGSSSLEATSIGRSSRLSGVVPEHAQATTGVGVSQTSPVGQDRLVVPPAAPGDARTLKVASVVGQGTGIAPALQPVPAQGARSRAERARVGDEGAAPQQDTQLLREGVGVLAAGKPLRPSPEPLASVAGTPNEQGAAAGDADAELGGSALPTNRSAAVSANEPPSTSGAAPLPAQQVAGQIVAAAHAIQREEAQPTGILAAKPAASSVVKVLRLELQPADLGTITIRMSLRQDGLDIRVEANRSDTASMLQRDQDSLAKLLTSAGYRIDGLAVVAAQTDGAAVADGRSQAFLPSSTPQHGGSSQPDSRSSGGRSNAEPDPRTSRGNQNDDSSDKSRVARGAGGDLYV